MKNTIRTIAIAAAVICALPGALPGAHASESYIKDKIDAGQPILIGVRSASIPLSYKLGDTYVGLAVELCVRSMDELKKVYPKATYKFVEVTSATRIDFLKAKKIDMECGSTTNTPQRREEINFSTPYYIANIGVMKLKSNDITSIDIFKNNPTIIYTDKTNTLKVLSDMAPGFRFKIQDKDYKVIAAQDHQQGFDMLSKGQGDVFINDNILLMSLRAKSSKPDDYVLLPNIYSIEPYGIMTRKDDKQIFVAVEKTIGDLMRSGEFTQLYNKWFMSPIAPFNRSLEMPMPSLLRDVIRMPTHIVGN